MPNHVSFLDGFFLYLFLPKESVYVINTQIAQRFKVLVNCVNHITIDPLNPYSLRRIINVVKDGVPLVLFPEGRITTTNGLMKIYDGIGFIALKTGATLYPVTINGLEYSKYSRITEKVKARWFPPVSIEAHKPINFTMDDNQSIHAQKRAASDRILRIMQNALFESRFNENGDLLTELIEAGDRFGWNTVIVEDLKQKVTYRRLVITANLLGKKIKDIVPEKETNVGLFLPNSVAHAATLFALFAIDRTPAILNFSTGLQSLKDCIETASLTTVITSKEFVEKGGFKETIDELGKTHRIIYLEDIKNTVSWLDKIMAAYRSYVGFRHKPVNQPQIILFTSGSESKAKGVVLKHSNVLANVIQVQCSIDLHSKDKMLNALPMFHSFGLTAGTILPLLTGVPLFLYPSPLHIKLIPEVSYDINATIILGTPTFLYGYGRNAHPYDFYSARYVIAGGEKVKGEVRDLWQDKFGLRILEGYGCTETAPVLSVNTPLCYKAGSVGRFLPGINYRIEKVEGILEGGKLLVKGPNVMEGYLLHGQGFVPAEDWYDCGDIVQIDHEGYLTIKSRLKRFAKIGGEMVSLNLVEELADKCFGPHHNYAAITLPDAKKGEKIILVTTNAKASLSDFRSFLSEHQFSQLIAPSEIVGFEKVPLLGSGKTDYITLRNLVGDGRQKSA